MLKFATNAPRDKKIAATASWQNKGTNAERELWFCLRYPPVIGQSGRNNGGFA
jgi:hypothetical protein